MKLSTSLHRQRRHSRVQNTHTQQLKTTPRTLPQLTRACTTRYMSLPQGTRVQAEYVWIGGTGQDLRCKTRTLEEKPTAVDQLPLWNYDGSSCGQAPGDDSEVMLRPVKIYPVSFCVAFQAACLSSFLLLVLVLVVLLLSVLWTCRQSVVESVLGPSKHEKRKPDDF